MSYILPLLIDNRRSYYLNLHEDHQPPAETFIVQAPDPGDEFGLLSIDKSKTLYTLVNGRRDTTLSGCAFRFGYDAAANMLDIYLSEAGEERPAQNAAVFAGAEFSFTVANDAYDISLSARQTTRDLSPLKQDWLLVRVVFEQEDGTAFSNSIRIFLANKSNFVQCGLDFGSEASQLTEKYYRRQGHIYKSDVEEVNLFSVLANYKSATESSSSYLQHEAGTNYLRSVFFIKNKVTSDEHFITDSSELDVITRSSTLNSADFLANWRQLPNLKLAHKHNNILNDIEFFVTGPDGRSRRRNLAAIKDVAYSSILKELFAAYFDHRISEQDSDAPLYFRITLLVPNIYNIDDIYNSKNIIREIVEALNKDLGGRIKGIEVLSLSESDASFLGYYRSGMQKTEKNKFYLIVDCGKGTTDFSILKTDKEHANNIKPIYRNGFAGAGNLISFAFFDTLIGYLIRHTDHPENAYNFFSQKLKDADSFKLYNLFNLIEGLKKNYKKERSREVIDAEFRQARDVDLNIKNLFDEDPDLLNIYNIIRKTQSVYDWSEYIDTILTNITDNIADNLENVIDRIDADVSCGGILLTGRAFLFAPLMEKLKGRLKQIERLRKATISTPQSEEMKSVCMKGIFKQGIVTNAETSGSPLPLPLNDADKKEIASKKTWKEAREYIRKKMKSMFDTEFENIDEYNFSRELVNVDYNELKFIIGSNLFAVEDSDFYKPANTKISDYIFTNQGYVVRAFDDERRLRYKSNLVKDDSIDNFAQRFIIPSMFPNKIDPRFFRSLNEGYKPGGNGGREQPPPTGSGPIDIDQFL